MAKGFLKRVFRAISQADIVLEVVDARFIDMTRNKRIEEVVRNQGKSLLIVVNKTDLVGIKAVKTQKKSLGKNSVFLSTKSRKGVRRLREAISRIAGKRSARVAVIGFPNTGKSSVINCLRGKKVARVSKKAGFTRGEQLVRIGRNTLLIDSPGVIPFQEKDAYSLAIVGAKNPEDLEDVELGGLRLLEHLKRHFPEKLEKIVGKENMGKSEEELLEKIALKWKKLGKGGKPDTNAVSSSLLRKWQTGKI